MLGSYCHYYSHHAIVVTTIVTTVAIENRMTMHVIFFLIYGCQMSGTVFKKKSSFKDDNDNDDDDNDNDNTKVCAALPDAKERRAKNDHERTFSRVRRHHCDSWNLLGASTGSSRIIGIF